MGDILPNQNSFRFNKKVVGKGSKVKRDPVELGNVTKKVHNAILKSIPPTQQQCLFKLYFSPLEPVIDMNLNF